MSLEWALGIAGSVIVILLGVVAAFVQRTWTKLETSIERNEGFIKSVADKLERSFERIASKVDAHEAKFVTHTMQLSRLEQDLHWIKIHVSDLSGYLSREGGFTPRGKARDKAG